MRGAAVGIKENEDSAPHSGITRNGEWDREKEEERKKEKKSPSSGVRGQKWRQVE